jgi:hypothetical protein
MQISVRISLPLPLGEGRVREAQPLAHALPPSPYASPGGSGNTGQLLYLAPSDGDSIS